MYSIWTSHIKDPEEKARFLNHIQSAKPVLERLLNILKEREAAIDQIERSVKQFEIPNWDYRQAFYNGERAQVAQIVSIIDLEKQETPNDRKPIDPPVHVHA